MWTNIKMVQFALGRGGAQPSLDTIKGLLMDFIWTEYSVSQFGGTYPPIGPFFVEYMNSDTGFGPFALWIKPDSGPFHHLCKQFICHLAFFGPHGLSFPLLLSHWLYNSAHPALSELTADHKTGSAVLT